MCLVTTEHRDRSVYTNQALLSILLMDAALCESLVPKIESRIRPDRKLPRLQDRKLLLAQPLIQ